jgi:hypothetical protein
MGWGLGYDDNWGRDIGYAVPAYCDHPGCNRKIDRGLSYVCGGEPYGGENGCGLYFCGHHLTAAGQKCACCANRRRPYKPTPDHPEWISHKLTDESWATWRDENPSEVARLRIALLLPTEEAARAEFEKQHEGRNLRRHHLRGTYSSPPIAALWNQHIRSLRWLKSLLERAQEKSTKEPA